jgi:hypothetical protein
MSVIDQEDKVRMEDTKHSFITNFIKLLFALSLRPCFNVTLFLHPSNSVNASNKVDKMSYKYLARI